MKFRNICTNKKTTNTSAISIADEFAEKYGIKLIGNLTVIDPTKGILYKPLEVGE